MFRNKFLKAVGLLLVSAPLVLASSGWAADKPDSKKNTKKKAKSDDDSAGSTYQPPYGMAGCGLGSLVIKDDSIMQIFAATLNQTGVQTSAISSTGSSNCGVTKEDVARNEQEVFVASNMRGLEVDVSRGGGTYSFAFAQVLGCDGDASYGEFLEVSRANYRDIFSSADPKVVYARYLDALRANAKLAGGCERVIIKS